MVFLIFQHFSLSTVLLYMGLMIQTSTSFCLFSPHQLTVTYEKYYFAHQCNAYIVPSISNSRLARQSVIRTASALDDDQDNDDRNLNTHSRQNISNEDTANEEKSSKFSTSLRKGLKSIKSFGRDAPMPRAIAALIRDAAQAAVEVAVEEIHAKVVKSNGINDGEEDGNDVEDYSQVVDFARVAKAAEAAVETSFANRSFRAKLEVLTQELVTLTADAERTAEECMAAAVSAAELANKAQRQAKQVASQAVAVQEILNQMMFAQPTETPVELDQPSTTGVTSSKPGFSEARTLTFSDVDFSASSMAPPFIGEDQCLVPGEAIVRVEKAPDNSRRIFAGIDIMSSVDEVWNVLTDYENLQKVVPNLVTNKIIKLYETETSLSASSVLKDSQLTPEEQCRIVSERLKGARLYQVGGAKIAGINFSAKTTLDVREWPEGLPDFAHYGDEVYEGKSREKRAKENTNIPLKRYNFPRPFAISSLPHKDISMQSIENDDGEFRIYQGVWRMQPLPGCAPVGGNAMRLTYAVEISPRSYLPVRLIEGRIAQDLCANLKAIRDYVTILQNSTKSVVKV